MHAWQGADNLVVGTELRTPARALSQEAVKGTDNYACKLLITQQLNFPGRG
jgi:hypothetical protein